MTARSRCEPYRDVILAKLEAGLSGQRICQDPIDEHGEEGTAVSLWCRKAMLKEWNAGSRSA